jgi:hypothetical protein
MALFQVRNADFDTKRTPITGTFLPQPIATEISICNNWANYRSDCENCRPAGS